MAKTVILFLSLLLTAAASYFSLNNLGKMKALRAEIDVLERDIAGLNKDIDTTDTNIATRKGELDNERRTNGQLIAERDGLNGDISQLKSEIPGLDEKLTAQKAEIEKYEAIIAKLKKFFEQMNVNDMNELNEKIKQLANDRVAREKELAETQALVEAASAAINKSEGQLSDWRQRQSVRSQGLGLNASEPVVMAVNADWGFVVINAGSDQGYAADKPLLVKRGDTFIAKLAITSLQKSQMVADIVPGSMAKGVTVLPGDRIILGAPNR